MLTERQKEILIFHGGWPGGNMEAATRNQFGVPFARYIQELHTALDEPSALEHDPMLVKRLQRIRDRQVLDRSRPYTERYA